MFRIIANTLFILFVATPSVVICETQLARGHRNVVFIVVDDLRPAIGKYGDPIAVTPNLDRFLSQSSYFTRAYCQQALCAPSRNSMLTSRRPDTLHLYDFYSYWRTLAGNFTTLPQYFKENGYHTYSIGKIFHPGISSNFTDDYPVSWSLPTFHPRTEAYMSSPVCPDGSGTFKQNVVCPVNVHFQPEKTLPDIESIGEARKFLLQHKSDPQPFFLAIGIHKPHIPFRFPEKYLKLHDLDKFNNTNHMRRYGVPDVAWNPYLDIRKRDDGKKWKIPFPYGPISKDFAGEIQQAYYASVSYIDNLFGQLISEIDMNNTIVVFTSDHGWSLGEHGEWAKYSNFDVALRVPLAFYIPGIQSQQIDNIVELVDVFPTLVELAAGEVLPSCKQPSIELLCTEGRSLVHLLQGYQSGWPDRALSQYPRPGRRPSITPNSDEPRLKQIKIMGYTLRTPDFRYTLWVKFYRKTFRKDWNKIFGEELYDHRLDSSENINLADRIELKNVRLHLRSELIKSFR